MNHPAHPGGYRQEADVAPISHEWDEPVRVRRGELQEWANEVEHVMRTPIDAPGLWKVSSLTVAVSALFYGLTLLPIYLPKNAPSPSLWAIVPAALLFALGVITFLFTTHVEKDTKRMGDREKSVGAGYGKRRYACNYRLSGLGAGQGDLRPTCRQYILAKLRAEQERDEALDQLERVQNEYLFLGRDLVAFLRANGRQP